MAAPRVRPVPIEMTAEAPTAARTHVHILQHELVMDEPKQRHGTDLAPTPLDTMVASLAGCTNVVLNLIARENDVDLHDLTMEVKSALDARGIRGIEDVRRPIERVDLVIRFASTASADKLDILKRTLPKRCAVNVIFREAGIEVNEIWDIRRA